MTRPPPAIAARPDYAGGVSTEDVAAWLDGAAAMAALLGVHSEHDLAELLPRSLAPPAWWVAAQSHTRARVLAPRVVRLWMAVTAAAVR